MALAAYDRLPERLMLTEDESEAFRHQAGELISETVEAFERFVDDGRQFSPSDWKVVKKSGRFTAYRDRSLRSRDRQEESFVYTDPSMPELIPSLRGVDADVSLRSNYSTVSSRYSQSMLSSKPSHMPALVASGTVDGTVNEYLLGTLTDTSTHLHHDYFRKVYMENDFDCWKVLAVLESPSMNSCFQYLRIIWAATSRPIQDKIVSPRDFLILEATGTRPDPTGSGHPLGYHLGHTISTDQIQPFPRVIRAEFSFCHILRQTTSDTVEMYSPGFVNPFGRVLDAMALHVSIRILFSTPTFIEAGRRKKLQWFTERVQEDKREMVKKTERLSRKDPAYCKSCDKRMNKIKPLKAKRLCQICSAVVCSKCGIIKTLVLGDAKHGFSHAPQRFCKDCVNHVYKLSAEVIALASTGPMPSVSYKVHDSRSK